MTEIDWATLHKDATTVIEGKFPVVVTEAVAKIGGTGKPMIACKLRVESGVYAGRTVFNNFNVTADNANAMRMFFGQMAIFGLDSKFWAANSHAPTEQIAQALVGRRAIAVIEPREWQGALRENVAGWEPAPGGPGGGALASGVFGTVSTPVAEVVVAAAPAQPHVAAPSTPAPEDPFR